MSLAADSIIDRRRLRRRLSLWRGLALLAFVVLLVGTLQVLGGGGFHLFATPYVARLEVTGLITEDRDVIDALSDLIDDDSARALIVYIDSPGGTVVGGEALFAGLRKIAEHKPVVAVMGTTAASAGYMVATAADTVFARAGTITGSIGVIFQTFDVTGLLGTLGIEPTAIKSAPLKAVPSPLEPLTPEARKATQGLVDEVYAMFVEMVRERRDLSPERLSEVSDGRVFTGRQALDLGLIDAIGGEDEARTWLETTHHISHELPTMEIGTKEEESMLLGLASVAFGKRMLPERLRLDGLVALWHPDLRL